MIIGKIEKIEDSVKLCCFHIVFYVTFKRRSILCGNVGEGIYENFNSDRFI